MLQLDQSLFSTKNLLEEVLVHHGLLWHVQLHYKQSHKLEQVLTCFLEVSHEVTLSLELSFQLTRHHHSLLTPLRLVGVDFLSIHLNSLQFYANSN